MFRFFDFVLQSWHGGHCDHRSPHEFHHRRMLSVLTYCNGSSFLIERHNEKRCTEFFGEMIEARI